MKLRCTKRSCWTQYYNKQVHLNSLKSESDPAKEYHIKVHLKGLRMEAQTAAKPSDESSDRTM